MKKRTHQGIKQAMDAYRSMTDAAMTVAMRTPILLEAAMTGSPKAMREAQRMWTEKAQAAVEGSIAMGTAWTQLWFKLALGATRPAQLPGEVAKVAQAAASPAHRACRANVRRLTRTRRAKARRKK